MEREAHEVAHRAAASLPPRLEGTLGKDVGRGHLGRKREGQGHSIKTCPISQASEWPKERPID